MRSPLNKLAILAFTLLLFFSTMLWYLANGSLNEYLKSQVLLQSHYYSGQQTSLINAEFTAEKGVTFFHGLTVNNFNGLSQPVILSIDKITAQLAQVPTSQLNSPSIQNKTTTIVHIEQLTLANLEIWSEKFPSDKTNIQVLHDKVSLQLAKDYPALYPEISAQIYAKEHPELNEKLALQSLAITQPQAETNQAVIEAIKAKQTKRLLGKAQTRVIISALIINNLSFNNVIGDKVITTHQQNINLGGFGGETGLDSNQLGGELLKAISAHLMGIESK